jgi:aspartate kinase
VALIVQKFGESCKNDSEWLQNAVDRIAEAYEAGHSIVAVVSAQGGKEEELIKQSSEINPNPSKREMDMLLSCGEQYYAALLSIAIERRDLPAISLTGYQAGITTDSIYGSARIKLIDGERIFRELDRKNIVVVAGVQGWNRFDDITTLGTGGADTTAVALAAALKADSCEIYTDTDGVFTADPAIVRNAARLNDISYDEMLELASLGANVMHTRPIELARKFNVNLFVRSCFNRSPGTNIKEVGSVEKISVRGVARDSNIARIAVIGIEDKPGMAFKLFSLLAKENINVDLIIQSAGKEEDTKDISFTVAKGNLEKALLVINSNLSIFNAKEVKYSDRYTKVSVVGAGMLNNPGVAATTFEALYDADINIHMITTSEIKISVLVDAQDADRAVFAIHEKFRLGELGQ